MKRMLTIPNIHQLTGKTDMETGLRIENILYDETSYRIGFKYDGIKGNINIQRIPYRENIHNINWKWSRADDSGILLDSHIDTQTKIVETILSIINVEEYENSRN